MPHEHRKRLRDEFAQELMDQGLLTEAELEGVIAWAPEWRTKGYHVVRSRPELKRWNCSPYRLPDLSQHVRNMARMVPEEHRAWAHKVADELALASLATLNEQDPDDAA